MSIRWDIHKKEIYFTLAYVVYLFRGLIEISTLKQYIMIDGIVYWGVRIILLIFVILQIYTIDRYSKKSILQILAIIVIFLISGFSSRYTHLCDIVLLLIAACKLELKKIVKVFFTITVVFMSVVFCLSLAGVIENYAFVYETRRVRYAFGSVYATDFAAMIFYLQMCHAYLKKNKCTIKYVIFWLLFGAFILCFCDARLDTILIISFAVIMLIHDKWKYILDYKLIKWILKYGVLFTCGISITLHMLYSNENVLLEKINKLLSGRLKNGNQAIKDYGFSLFGNNIKEQGNGWSVKVWDDTLGYYFVDCGYLSIALKYGVIILAILVLSYYIKIKQNLEKEEYILPIILNFMGISSMIDHHVFQIAYNPFIFVISVVVAGKTTAKARTPNIDSI